MKRTGIFVVLFASASVAFAQSDAAGQRDAAVRPPAAGDYHAKYDNSTREPYHPAVAAPTATVYGGGGYGGGTGGASTAQGAALQGMSQVISSAGQYNLNTSAAAINMTQAKSNQMKNQVQGVDTFWAMREMGREARARERGPNATPEEFARRAREGAPRPLSAREMDPVTGRLNWPDALQDPSYGDQRTELDQICSKWASYGALDFSERGQVRETIGGMYSSMKEQMSQMPQSFVAAKTFLQSVLYAATKTTL